MLNNKPPRSIHWVRDTLIEAFEDLRFDEPTHSYTLHGRKLTSTTTVLKEFYEEFDEKHQSRQMAKKINLKTSLSKKRTPEYYIDRWECQNKTATYSGSRVHNYAEYNWPDFVEPPTCPQELGVIEFFFTLPENYEVVYLELRMHSYIFGKAGTADIILYNHKTGKIVIADWKTNKKNLIQYYQGKTLHAPFEHLWETELNKYSLQLCDYQNMLEMATPFEVEARWIIHLSDLDPKQIDFARRTEADKFRIDIKNLPETEGEHFKIYHAKDHTKLLRTLYRHVPKQ